MITMPMCWKCTNLEKKPAEDGRSFVMIGCKVKPEITCFEQARTLCPLLGQPGTVKNPGQK
jgi:hypothetical protein